MSGYKTIASNLVLFLVYALQWDNLAEYVSPEWIASLTAALNIGLRFITTTPVFVKK